VDSRCLCWCSCLNEWCLNLVEFFFACHLRKFVCNQHGPKRIMPYVLDDKGVSLFALVNGASQTIQCPSHYSWKLFN
jgi:hypothetical protein